MFPLTHAAYRLLGKGTMQNYEIYLGKENNNGENNGKNTIEEVCILCR